MRARPILPFHWAIVSLDNLSGWLLSVDGYGDIVSVSYCRSWFRAYALVVWKELSHDTD